MCILVLDLAENSVWKSSVEIMVEMVFWYNLMLHTSTLFVSSYFTSELIICILALWESFRDLEMFVKVSR